MEFTIQLAKWKWLGTKDIDLNKAYIWVNWPVGLWVKLFTMWNSWMKLRVWEMSELICYIGDSTTPFRWTNDDSVLLQLMVEINPEVIWALLTYPLTLIID